MSAKPFVMFIDAENTSPDHAGSIVSHAKSFGALTGTRVHGAWAGGRLKSWEDAAEKHGFEKIDSPRPSKGKNAADIAMVIDAMYACQSEGFIIVSSDGDFTSLAHRLSQSGASVIGMGRKAASRSLMAACDSFVVLEEQPVKDLSEAGQIVRKALIAASSPKAGVTIPDLYREAREVLPEFSPKRYGSASLPKLIDRLKCARMKGSGPSARIILI
ncbi:MAG: NYN domain-containing protein [Pseudomonadota bacterium]